MNKQKLKMNRDIIMVDFDGTLTLKDNFYTGESLPNKKVINWVNNQYKEGNVIIIYTARPYEAIRETVAWLIQYSVKYHGLNFDKPEAQLYVDDKVINVVDLNGI